MFAKNVLRRNNFLPLKTKRIPSHHDFDVFAVKVNNILPDAFKVEGEVRTSGNKEKEKREKITKHKKQKKQPTSRSDGS